MAHLHEDKIKELELKANDIRKSIIEMLVLAGSGHSAGPLGMADVFTALFFHILKHDPKNPSWPERDRLVLSNGHICPVLYATMAHAGYFPLDELKTLRKLGTRLQGHPHREWLPFVETSSGPLGSGLSQAIGMALADRIDSKNKKGEKRYIFALMSDGELDAGQNWEALMLGGKEKLNNLIAIVDRNNIQIDGFTENIMPLEPLANKLKAFNWNVLEITGHNFQEIVNAVEEAKSVYEKPTIILSHNIPGKGVSFMERRFEWHGMPPNKEQAVVAIEELRIIREKIVKDHE